MGTIQDLFRQSQVAEAAYANFAAFPNNPKDALEDAGFSATQASAFVEQWQVLSQYTSPPGTFGITDGVGFSATLFQDRETGQYVFAVRGSELGFSDLAADLGDIVADGLALDQIIEMYNYWQSLTHVGVYQAATLETSIDETATLRLMQIAAIANPINPEFQAAYDAYLASLKQDGAILDSTLLGTTVRRVVTGNSDVLLAGTPLAAGSGQILFTPVLSVTGHSLGGHLASAFTRFFPNVPANAVSINGAGFATGLIPGLGGDAAANIQNLFFELGGAGEFSPAAITNVHGDGLNFVAMNSQFGLVQPGAANHEIYIERMRIAETFGHGSSQMTDTLALYATFAKIDPALGSADPGSAIALITGILKAVSVNPSMTLESALDCLRRLFIGADVGPTVTDNLVSREEYWANLLSLTKNLEAFNASIESLIGKSANDLILAATNPDTTNTAAIAYRYALKELNPFAVIGVDYSPHNANGELDRYDPETHSGGLTQAWIEDRAAFLVRLTQINIADRAAVIGVPDTYTVQGSTTYVDLQRGLTLQGDFHGTKEFVKFGSDQGDWLAGASAADRLYGGKGADVLSGAGGTDWLEGGEGGDELYGGGDSDVLQGGNGDDTLDGGPGGDRLEGGSGRDTYKIGVGGGTDVIFDSDGAGSIELGGTVLTGGQKIGAQLWQSNDGLTYYAQSEQVDGSATLTIWNNSAQILVEDFQNGALDLALGEDPPRPPVAAGGGREIRGDHAYKVFDHPDLNEPLSSGYFWSPIKSTTYPYDYLMVDDLNNIVRDPDVPWGAGWQLLFGSEGDDHIVIPGGTAIGYGGDDHVVGSDDGGDQIGGGDGDDFIEGGNYTGPFDANDELVYPDGEIILGAAEDYIAGVAGDDILFAGRAADMPSIVQGNGDPMGHRGDWITAGEGADLVYGAATDDVLLGGWGKDTMYGGPGADVLDGDDNYRPYHPVYVSAGRWEVEQGPGPFDISFYPIITPRLDELQYYTEGGNDDVLFGGSGKDLVLGMYGNDKLFGEDGDDLLAGWEGDDSLFGGDGDDLMAGDFGTDEQPGDRYAGYNLHVVPGAVGIYTGEIGKIAQTGDDFLDGGAGSDVLLGEGGDDTLLGGDGDDVISGDANYLPEELHGADYLDGGAGNDLLIGGGGDDNLRGGPGDDSLDGGEGADSYFYSKGDGFDVIADRGTTGVDVLVLRDQSSHGVVVNRNANGSIKISCQTGDLVLIMSQAGNSSAGIESIRFADGVVIDSQSLVQLPVDPTSVGGDGWTTGTDGGDFILTTELTSSDPSGYVLVNAAGGNDTVLGANDAIVYGGLGNDTLEGGHELFGGEDNDVLRYGDYMDGGSGDDQLESGQTLVGGAGNDRLIGGTNLEGGEGNDELYDGTTLDGGAGDDLLDGGGGADRYVVNPAEFGVDLIADSGGSRDAFFDAYYISIGIPDWIQRVGITTTAYIIWSGEGPVFNTEEEVRTFFQNRGMTLEEAIANRDLEILEPLPPTPEIAANNYEALEPHYQSGIIELDSVEFGAEVSVGDLAFSWGQALANLSGSGNGDRLGALLHLTLDIGWGEAGKAVKIAIPRASDVIGSGIELFQFADGSVLSLAQLITLAPPRVFVATENPDLLVGTSLNDSILSLGGNDEIDGDRGNDALDGGSGDDLIHGGAGSDVLLGGDGADILEDLQGSNVFGAGTGSDFVYAGDRASFIAGGQGDDQLEVGAAHSVVAFNAGDGQDTVYVAGDLTLSIGGGIGAEDLYLARDGTDMILSLGTNDTIRLTRQWEIEPQAWPSITLQLFGSVYTYDFNAVIAEFNTQVAGNPSLILSLGEILPSHLLSYSADEALGGEIAYRYATTGSLAALSDIELQDVLGDENFGIAPQQISSGTNNRTPTVANALADQAANEDLPFEFTIPDNTFVDQDAILFV
ncbi:MAG: calcium-binding protein [Gammaproteobacteria bacterium]